MDLYSNIEQNKQHLKEVFSDCGDLVAREFPAAGHDAFLLYFDGMTDREVIDFNVMSRLMKEFTPPLGANLSKIFSDYGITTSDLSEVATLEEVELAVMSGDTALLIDKCTTAIIISTKGWSSRGVPEAQTEVVVQGSKEAFSEGIRINTALIRRRIRDSKLKVKQCKVGQRSSSDVAIMYLSDVVRQEILDETERRLNNIDIDAILDAGMLEGLIEDDWLSPFPQTEITERPDKASAAIFEGRIAIIVDNSPLAILVPATMGTFYQSSEDYYQRFHIASFVRLLRYVAGFIAIALPALYVAVAIYHPSMIPLRLALRVAGTRENVPFPALVELLIMEFAFELLREAGIRLPNPVGSSIGVVGGLIVGQAAVEAGLVSPIVVIVIALTGIASFAIPNYSLAAGIRLVKLVLIFLSASLGLLGFWLGALAVLVHFCSLKSFGVPYMYPFTGISGNSEAKDGLVRAPIFAMKERPFFANPGARRRLNPKYKGNRRERE